MNSVANTDPICVPLALVVTYCVVVFPFAFFCWMKIDERGEAEGILREIPSILKFEQDWNFENDMTENTRVYSSVTKYGIVFVIWTWKNYLFGS